MQSVAKLRSILAIRSCPVEQKWGGVVGICSPEYKQSDPFIFAVWHDHKLAAGQQTGFPPHAHRGFETITVTIKGTVDHQDSKGNKGRYGDGDIQWMTAGKGVLHSEMFVTSKKHETAFRGFQIWLNLPEKLRMTEPAYGMVYKNEIPVVELPKSAGSVKVIGGEVNGVAAKIRKVTVLLVSLNSGGVFSLPLPSDHSCTVFAYEGGSIHISDREISPLKYVTFAKDGTQIEILNKGEKRSEFLLLSGKSFDEPFYHHGPFVGGSRDEVRKAFADLSEGLFGEVEGFSADNHWLDE